LFIVASSEKTFFRLLVCGDKLGLREEMISMVVSSAWQSKDRR
jgi:hypothetical protein